MYAALVEGLRDVPCESLEAVSVILEVWDTLERNPRSDMHMIFDTVVTQLCVMLTPPDCYASIGFRQAYPIHFFTTFWRRREFIRFAMPRPRLNTTCQNSRKLVICEHWMYYIWYRATGIIWSKKAKTYILELKIVIKTRTIVDHLCTYIKG